MPQRTYCQNCGYELYSGLELEPPLETIHKHGGFCPNCKTKLSFEVDSIKIIPLGE
ncbi:MAG: hypothetical protein ACUVTM_06930 [Candidatus Bathyarchaeia archaeon]